MADLGPGPDIAQHLADLRACIERQDGRCEVLVVGVRCMARSVDICDTIDPPLAVCDFHKRQITFERYGV